MRIVSLLPAATEIVVALELQHALVGRTHECDHPAGITDVPAVTGDLLPRGLAPAAIDKAVREGLTATSTIYQLDTGALAAARPDFIITQHTCSVCAVDGSEVERAVADLDLASEIIAYDPHRLTDLPSEAERLGRALGVTRAGLALQSHLERRIAFVQRAVADLSRLRVAVIEWPDPLFSAGHWVPDLVEAAGATSVFGVAGRRSETATWQDLNAAKPDVLVLSFCGFDLSSSIAHAAPLVEDGRLAATGARRVIAVDGNAWFSRPGPRMVDGIEALAFMLHDTHPDLRPESEMGAELVDGVWVDAAAVRV